MGITLVIVGGFVAVTFMAALFDYLGKARKHAPAAPTAEVAELRRRVEALEAAAVEREDKVLRLERDVGFVTRLLEDKSK